MAKKGQRMRAEGVKHKAYPKMSTKNKVPVKKKKQSARDAYYERMVEELWRPTAAGRKVARQEANDRYAEKKRRGDFK